MRRKALFIVIVFITSWTSMFSQEKIAVDGQKIINDEFRHQMENNTLKLKSNQIAFGKISNTEIKTDSVLVYNDSDTDMKLTFDRTPKYITLKTIPSVIKPKHKALLIATFDPAQNKNEKDAQIWGATNVNVNVIVNDNKENGTKNLFFFSAMVEEDFTKYTPKQLANAPIIEFEMTKYDFGKVKQGTTAKYDFVFRNKGKEDLEIRSVKAG